MIAGRRIDPLVKQTASHCPVPLLITKARISLYSWSNSPHVVISDHARYSFHFLSFAFYFSSFSGLSLILSDDVSVLLQEIIVEARNLSDAEM